MADNRIQCADRKWRWNESNNCWESKCDTDSPSGYICVLQEGWWNTYFVWPEWEVWRLRGEAEDTGAADDFRKSIRMAFDPRIDAPVPRILQPKAAAD